MGTTAVVRNGNVDAALKVLRHRDDEPLTNVMSMKAINVNKGYCRQRVGKSWGRVLTIGEMKQILGRKMA